LVNLNSYQFDVCNADWHNSKIGIYFLPDGDSVLSVVVIFSEPGFWRLSGSFGFDLHPAIF
jgi:hypothetical protein